MVESTTQRSATRKRVDTKRTKTGCLTCRLRRIKCDERQPTCMKCFAAHYHCDGYPSPKELVPKVDLTLVNEPKDSEHLYSKVLASSTLEKKVSRPHNRGRELMAHRHYATYVAPQIFGEKYQSFWVDELLEVSLEHEWMFDAIVALGSIHRATLLSTLKPSCPKSTDSRITAFQSYSHVLKHMYHHQATSSNQIHEIAIAVLLLCSYFEVFANNKLGAIQHLCAAKDRLGTGWTDDPSVARQALFQCIKELGFIVQIILPLPLTRFPFQTAMSFNFDSITFTKAENPRQELQSLLDLILSARVINVSIWSPTGTIATELDDAIFCSFHKAMISGLLAAKCTGKVVLPLIQSEMSQDFAITVPPVPLHFETVESGVATALYFAYQSRVKWLRARTTGKDEHGGGVEWEAYHALRAVATILKDHKEAISSATNYKPCNAVPVGLIPLLYLAGQHVGDLELRAWAVKQIRNIQQEGVYHGEPFAIALENLETFQNPAVPRTQQVITALEMQDVLPVIIPAAYGDSYTVYYVQTGFKAKNGIIDPAQVVGRVVWRKDDIFDHYKLTVEHFKTSEEGINAGATTTCVYRRIARHDPVASDWERLLGPESLGQYGYLKQLLETTEKVTEKVGEGDLMVFE